MSSNSPRVYWIAEMCETTNGLSIHSTLTSTIDLSLKCRLESKVSCQDIWSNLIPISGTTQMWIFRLPEIDSVV